MVKEIISSTQNPQVKNLRLLLEKSSERRKQQIIVVEGAREIRLAQKGGFVVHTLWVCEELAGTGQERNFPDVKMVFITKAIFEKIAFREGSDGLLALLQARTLQLSNVRLSVNPIVIILESVEKPGNLGAILRTADAAMVDAVIVCDPRTDIYNPNCIRSSVGCIFTNQVVTAETAEVMEWIARKKLNCYSAALTATKNYHQTDLTQPLALVFGTEAHGLSQKWLGSFQQIKIPMLGKIDSLNVSTSAAIITFEARRQRGFL